MLQHRKLQILAGAEMREEPGLGHARSVRQAADGQTLEPELARTRASSRIATRVCSPLVRAIMRSVK